MTDSSTPITEEMPRATARAVVGFLVFCEITHLTSPIPSEG
jgi:hypothetical protein